MADNPFFRVMFCHNYILLSFISFLGLILNRCAKIGIHFSIPYVRLQKEISNKTYINFLRISFLQWWYFWNRKNLIWIPLPNNCLGLVWQYSVNLNLRLRSLILQSMESAGGIYPSVRPWQQKQGSHCFPWL